MGLGIHFAVDRTEGILGFSNKRAEARTNIRRVKSDIDCITTPIPLLATWLFDVLEVGHFVVFVLSRLSDGNAVIEDTKLILVEGY